MLIKKPTQAERVLRVLEEANGGWISGRYFLQTMLLSQYHARIWELQNDKAAYGYEGTIEPSDFKDEHGFLFYRLVKPKELKQEGLPLHLQPLYY